jgi:hypothetical protein
MQNATNPAVAIIAKWEFLGLSYNIAILVNIIT